MRAVWVITLAALASTVGAWAQAPVAPQGRFYGPMVPRAGVPKFFQRPLNLVQRQPAYIALRPAIPRCVVPLIEMKAPKAIDPGMQLTPRMDKVEPMPQAKVPPVCEMPSTR